MSFGSSVNLLFKLKADSSEADSALRNVAGDVSGLGNEFTALAGPAGLATAAITAVATIAVTAGARLFSLAKSASEMGSEIFDATEKTGLAAETISSLKVAAEQSGSSLQAVSSSLAKFAKTIGEAADGSDEAQGKLDKLKVTSGDLNTALGQALETIAKYPSGVQQMAAAQAAFGKSGADLLPFIKSFDGDLPGLIEKCKSLGLTINDVDAKAADAFGDTLDQLSMQTAAAGRQFAFGFMPEITRAMESISKSIASNQDRWREWGDKVGNILTGAQFSIDLLVKSSTAQFQILGGNLDGLTSHIWTALNPLVQLGNALDDIGSNPLVKQYYGDYGEQYGPFAKDMSPAKKSGMDTVATQEEIDAVNNKQRSSFGQEIERAQRAQQEADREAERKRKEAEAERKRAQVESDRAAREASQNALQAERDRVQAARQLFIDETTFFEAERRRMYAIAEEYAKREGKTEADLARYKDELDQGVLEQRKTKLQEYMDALVKGTSEYARAQQEMRLLEVEIEVSRSVHAKNQQTRDGKALEDAKKLHEEHKKHWKEYLEQLERERDAEDEANARRTRERGDRMERDRPVNSGVGGGIAGAIGTQLPEITTAAGIIKTQAEYIKEVYADMAQSAGQAIGSMVQGLSQLAINFVLTGKFSAKAALQMAAGILMGVGIQAAVKGVFELAEAAAAAARYDFASAALHKAAAGIYFKTAAIAGSLGVGIGLASRAVGGGESGASAQGAFNGATGGDTGAGDRQPLVFTQRFNGFQQEQQLTREVMGALLESNEMLARKISGVSPGQVVMMGAGEAGEAIASAVNTFHSDYPRSSTEFKRASGNFY